MTATVTKATIAAAESAGYGQTSVVLAVMVVLLLITLLIARVVAEAVGERRLAARVNVFNVAILPLLIVFGLFISARMWVILQYSPLR